MESLNVYIQMKAVAQYFPVVLLMRAVQGASYFKMYN